MPKNKPLQKAENIDFLTNRNQFEEIFKQYYRQLCSFAFKYLKEIDDSEEIVQDTFVNIWNNKDNLQNITSLQSYLYFCVRNSCLNKLKHIKIREEYKQYNQIEIQNGTDDVQKNAETNDLEQAIWQAIDKMPKERRKIFVLSRYESLSYKEIAEKLGISPKTVENQISSALKFLRIQLKDFIILFLPLLIGTIGVISFLIVLIKRLKI